MEYERGNEQQEQRVPGLDGVRGVAILIVMLYHFLRIFADNSLMGKGLHAVLSGGWLGVDVFFVLSGFLITGILLRTRERPRYYLNFYARRFLRIFPLYYTVLFLLLLLGLSFPRLACFGFVSNWLPNNVQLPWVGNLWSLAIEEQFYLVWPTLVLLLPVSRFPWFCMAVAGASIACRVALAALGHLDWAYSFTICRLDGLALGSLLAWIATVPGAPGLPSIARPLRAAAVGALAGLGVMLLLLRTLDASSALALSMAPELAGLGAAGMIAAAHSAKSGGVLNNSVLIWFGQYSYGLYLIHQIWWSETRGFYGPSMPGKLLRLVMGFGGCAALAWICKKTIENPCLRLKRYFAPAGSRAAIRPGNMVC